MEIIKAENLVYEYYSQEEVEGSETSIKAIDGINLSLEKGSFIAILGHNGSGKSTLAKHFNALLTPTSGSLFVKGYDTTKEENIWEVRQVAGMVFQNPDNQIIASIIEEDVAFGPENLGVPTEEIKIRIKESLEAVGMTEYRKHSPNKLSGGQKQRIAIAGVLAMKPECIILDEPTAMLDPVGRKEVLKTVNRLNKEEGITVIMITHFMEEVIEADVIFVMDHGKIVMQGTPKEIFSKVDQLKALRLDVPQVTEIAYELKKRNIDIPDGILTIDEFVEAFSKLRLI